MSPVCATGHMERVKEAKEANRVEIVEHLCFHLYLESSLHLCKCACLVYIVVFGPVRQLIATGVQGCPVVRIAWLDDGYRLL